jgi:hypothetical protein
LNIVAIGKASDDANAIDQARVEPQQPLTHYLVKAIAPGQSKKLQQHQQHSRPISSDASKHTLGH